MEEREVVCKNILFAIMIVYQEETIIIRMMTVYRLKKEKQDQQETTLGSGYGHTRLRKQEQH